MEENLHMTKETEEAVENTMANEETLLLAKVLGDLLVSFQTRVAEMAQ